jgi:hypothetical protein
MEGVEGTAVLTALRLVHENRRAGTPSASCLRERDWDLFPADRSAERVGVFARSVTFAEASGRSVFGCDQSPGSRSPEKPWCGGAWGRLQDGRLRDPRLDLVCATLDVPVAFAWIEPAPETRYVAVEHPGYVEVYEVAAGLPVRVATTSGIDLERSSARFRVGEHDASGRLVRRYRLDASAAG